MPRIEKQLPENRADYSFGDFVYWHAFVYGTRPTGDPSAVAGRIWEMSRFCEKLQMTERSLRNWVSDATLPDKISKLEDVLFGDNPLFDPWRLELREGLQRCRAQRRRKGFFSRVIDAATGTEPDEPSEAPREGEAGRRALPAPADRAAASGRSGAILSFAWRRLVRSEDESASGDPPWFSFSANYKHTPPRKLARVAVPVLALLIGGYIWSRSSPPRQEPEKQVAATPDKPMAAEPTQPSGDTPKQAKKEPPPKVEPSKPPHTEQEKRAAEEERIARQTVEAMKAANEKEARAKEDEARRLDREAKKAQEDDELRQWNARQVAGMGYRLMENTSMTGPSIGYVLAKTVTDCALACLRDKCAGFALPRKPAGELRSCYRYRAPLTLLPNGDYVGGQLAAIETSTPSTAPAAAADPPPALMAQAAPSAPTSSDVAPADDLTHCPNGPVKVSGFAIVCDRLLGGGSSPGSNRERYVVSNINACATYCKRAAHCSGFSYDAAQPGGQHDCQIFGRGFIANHGDGWVSGVR